MTKAARLCDCMLSALRMCSKEVMQLLAFNRQIYLTFNVCQNTISKCNWINKSMDLNHLFIHCLSIRWVKCNRQVKDFFAVSGKCLTRRRRHSSAFSDKHHVWVWRKKKKNAQGSAAFRWLCRHLSSGDINREWGWRMDWHYPGDTAIAHNASHILNV